MSVAAVNDNFFTNDGDDEEDNVVFSPLSSSVTRKKKKSKRDSDAIRRKKPSLSNHTDNSTGDSSPKTTSYWKCLKNLLWQKFYRRYVFLIPCFLFTGLQEIYDVTFSFRYNSLLIFILAGSIAFPYYPLNTIRFQLSLATVILFTFAMDAINFTWSISYLSTSMLVIKTLALSSKLGLFATFLFTTRHAYKVRKYLHRRLRLFLLPCEQPKRIMREVRGRLLALTWTHGIGCILYTLFVLVYTLYFDYSKIYVYSVLSSSFVLTFFVIKIFTSLLITLALLYDTNLRLCLWYFGCLGFALDSLRLYLANEKKRLHGWPLAFSFAKIRFYIVYYMKWIDIGWGAYGFYCICNYLTIRWDHVEAQLFVFFVSSLFCIAILDFFVLLLFFAIQWLLYRMKIMQQLRLLEKSDDSEIQEFHLDVEMFNEEEQEAFLAQQPKAMEKVDFSRFDLLNFEKEKLLRQPSTVLLQEKVKGKQKKSKFGRKQDHRVAPILYSAELINVNGERLDVLDSKLDDV